MRKNIIVSTTLTLILIVCIFEVQELLTSNFLEDQGTNVLLMQCIKT